MADAVTSNVIMSTPTHYVVHLTNICDTTGESAVAKVDKSGLTAQDGAEPASCDIEQVMWNVQGFTYIALHWAHTSPDVALLLAGSGYNDFRGRDAGVLNFNQTSGLLDPRSSGGTGDITLTTVGDQATDTYDITLWVRLTND